MDLESLKAIHRDVEETLLATEDWATTYRKNKATFKAIVSEEQDLYEALRRYFKALSGRVMGFVDWHEYRALAIKAADVVVSMDDEQWDEEAQVTFRVVFPEIATAYYIGTRAGFAEYKIDPGMATMQRLSEAAAMDHAGELIGMVKDPQTGLYHLNPKADKGLINTTRERVRQSITTSLQMGETDHEAALRLENVIDDEARALMIARTESVHAYGEGKLLYAQNTGATGKEWVTSFDPCPICESNALQGIIPMDQDFDSGDPVQPAHPDCKCDVNFYYDLRPEELN